MMSQDDICWIVTSKVDVVRSGAGTHAALDSQGGGGSLFWLENREYYSLFYCDDDGELTSLADLWSESLSMFGEKY